MKLIDASVQIIDQNPNLIGCYKHIELTGRVAYKSEDKITENSSKAFVQKLIDNKHTAVLEQGTIYLKIPNNVNTPDVKDLKCNAYTKFTLDHEYSYITTNARVIQQNGYGDLLKYLCEPTKNHKLRVTAKFVCSRAIANELVRHRVFSFVQESSRYCNYSNEKFNKSITFIKPSWYDKDLEINCKNSKAKSYKFEASLLYIEDDYMDLIDDLPAQFARDLLPLATKTELYMTGFVEDWIEVFKLRCDSHAHPDMQILANKLESDFYKRNYIKNNRKSIEDIVYEILDADKFTNLKDFIIELTNQINKEYNIITKE